jgi:DNA-binding response OmpR family regulator
MTTVIAKIRQSGADTYITKPFDSKMLVDKVEELLKRRVAFDVSANETMQVFHSRTEFLMGGQPPPEAPSPSIPPTFAEKAVEQGGGVPGGCADSCDPATGQDVVARRWELQPDSHRSSPGSECRS